MEAKKRVKKREAEERTFDGSEEIISEFPFAKCVLVLLKKILPAFKQLRLWR